jgi:hypothetical protein
MTEIEELEASIAAMTQELRLSVELSYDQRSYLRSGEGWLATCRISGERFGYKRISVHCAATGLTPIGAVRKLRVSAETEIGI